MRKKKVAILSLYYHNFNYGGVLQAYALQKAVSSLGIDAFQISYDLMSGYQKGVYNKIKYFVKKPVRYIYRKIVSPNIIDFENRFVEFTEKIPHTEVVTVDAIKRLGKEYDAFICGSDQIWNPIGWQPTLFLDFVPSGKPKIAYAASVARDNLNPEEIEFILQHIRDFKAVSVREERTAEILKQSQTRQNISVMPDPTMLLRPEEWSALTTESENTERKYVLAYFLGGNIEQREQAIAAARQQGKDILFIPYVCRSALKWEKDHEKYMAKNVGVPKFLTLIKNADAVITDSFHGTIFSIMFRTPFFVLERFRNDDSKSMNSRVVTLLKTFSLQNRLVDEIPQNEKWAFSNSELDCIEKVRTFQRQKGMDFLKRYVQ